MGIKKIYLVGRIREGNTIEIKVKDGSEALLDWWEFNIRDKKTISRIMRILKDKYGFEYIIEELDKDLKWLLGNE